MTADLHPAVAALTERIAARSRRRPRRLPEPARGSRAAGPAREALGCSNLAHGLAACDPGERARLGGERGPAVAIVTAYNDMLSAHQPFAHLPGGAARARCSAPAASPRSPAACRRCATGSPRAGRGWSCRCSAARWSRWRPRSPSPTTSSTAALLLGVCDKIVPGLLIGALSFGHLPALLVPAGPMPSGLPNAEKSRVRQRHAEGRAGREELLAAELASYHAPGHLHLLRHRQLQPAAGRGDGPAAARRRLRQPGDRAARGADRGGRRRVAAITALGDECTPLGEVVDERALVNAVVALLATGGSTNHTMHLVAIAAAAGIRLEWEDFAVALAARAAARPDLPQRRGRRQPLPRRRRHRAARSASCSTPGCCTPTSAPSPAPGCERYTRRPGLGDDGELEYAPVARPQRRPAGAAPAPRAVRPRRRAAAARRQPRPRRGQGLAPSPASTASVDAPARVFDDQAELLAAFERGRARARPRRRRPQPGPARQRDAGAAQADAGARRAADRGASGRAGHRRPHVGRLRQGAGGDPLHAGGGGRRAAGAAARRRRHRARLRRRPARASASTSGTGRRARARRPSRRAAATASAASCSPACAARRPGRRRRLGLRRRPRTPPPARRRRRPDASDRRHRAPR